MYVMGEGVTRYWCIFLCGLLELVFKEINKELENLKSSARHENNASLCLHKEQPPGIKAYIVKEFQFKLVLQLCQTYFTHLSSTSEWFSSEEDASCHVSVFSSTWRRDVWHVYVLASPVSLCSLFSCLDNSSFVLNSNCAQTRLFTENDWSFCIHLYIFRHTQIVSSSFTC